MATFSGSIYLSTNNGANWTPVSSGVANDRILALAASGNNLFAGADSGVFLSTNNGSSWTNVNSGWTSKPVSALAVSGSDLFAGSMGRGVWKRPLSEMTSVREVFESKLPNTFSLEQNYPNPFNPVTVIEYDIPSFSFVSLDIFDVLGRRAETLVNGYQNAQHYAVRFDASRFASGVYFYRLNAGRFVSTKKLLLIK